MPVSPEGNSFMAALHSGHTEAQIFFGRNSHFLHLGFFSKNNPFIKCLQNFVQIWGALQRLQNFVLKWGALQRLLEDHTGIHASLKVMDYLGLEHVGHAMTYRIWNKRTGKILERSAVCTTFDGEKQNLRANHLGHIWITTELSTQPPSARIRTAQDYGEMESGRPPDLIYSTNDEGIIEPNDHAEAAYLSEDTKPDDYLASLQGITEGDDAIYLVLHGDDRHSQLDHQGKPILIRGKDFDKLAGTSFIKHETTERQIGFVS